MEGILGTILRFVFFKLDEIVYKFIGVVYNLLTEIAETTIFSADVFGAFMERIYGILGIFMLFKVSFSILTYIVNPDDFTDKTKGFSKLIQNILITLGLLVFTPWIFDQAMDLQRIILKDDVLGKLVIGSTDASHASSEIDPGRIMAYETLTAFYHVDVDKYPACEEFVYGTEFDPTNCLESTGIDEVEEYGKTLKKAKATKGVGIYLDWDLVFAKDSNDSFVMEYIPLVSTAAGGFIVVVLIGFCFDVAVRSVKLGFMRMIAPVPIISRLDPKKGKGIFDKWVKNVISTYLDLFVRLLAIYFVIFVITNLSLTNAVTGRASEASLLVKAFIILGALMFAKQLPKLIEDILGIKLSGNFSLNPLKKAAGVPLAGNLAARTLGGVDSRIHGNRFADGWRKGGKAVSFKGDDKKSITEGMTGTKDWFNKRFGEDRIKRADEAAMRAESDKIYNKYKAGGNEAVYTGGKRAEDYIESVDNVKKAKDRMRGFESSYQKLMYRSQNGENISADKLNQARVDFNKAKGDYDKIKSSHDSLRKIDVDNARKEDLLNYAKDRHESLENVTKIPKPPKYVDDNNSIGGNPGPTSGSTEYPPNGGYDSKYMPDWDADTEDLINTNFNPESFYDKDDE